MKSIQIRKGSWHWWVAETFGGWKQYRSEDQWEVINDRRWYKGSVEVENDFCCYVRRFLLGALWLALLTLVATVAVAFVGMMEYALFRALMGGTWSKDASTGVAILIAGAAIGSLIGIMMWRARTKYERRDAAEARKEARAIEKLKNKDKESFLKHLYLSIKNRVCFKMEVTK